MAGQVGRGPERAISWTRGKKNVFPNKEGGHAGPLGELPSARHVLDVGGTGTRASPCRGWGGGHSLFREPPPLSHPATLCGSVVPGWGTEPMWPVPALVSSLGVPRSGQPSVAGDGCDQGHSCPISRGTDGHRVCAFLWRCLCSGLADLHPAGGLRIRVFLHEPGHPVLCSVRRRVEFLWSPLNTRPENTQNREDQGARVMVTGPWVCSLSPRAPLGHLICKAGIQTPLPWNRCPAFNRKICRKHLT